MLDLEMKISKYICFLLRHDKDFIADIEGWIDIKLVVDRLKKRFKILANRNNADIVSMIIKIVKDDDKQRYSIKDTKNKVLIRCNYGHSNETVNIKYDNDVPPLFLYHGTSKENYNKITKCGKIDIMGRQHVHLSEDIDTAINVGKRHGDPVVIVINAYDMYQAGSKFHRLENGIWLSEDPIDLSYENRCISNYVCREIYENRKIMNKSKNNIMTNLFNKDTSVINISNNSDHISVKRMSKIFNELINQGKGDYKVNLCGSNEYYLYNINSLKLISLDVSPDEFSDE